MRGLGEEMGGDPIETSIIKSIFFGEKGELSQFTRVLNININNIWGLDLHFAMGALGNPPKRSTSVLLVYL